MDTASGEALRRARARFDLGFYADATELLQHALDDALDSAKPLLATELAHVYSAQALIKDALRTSNGVLESPWLIPGSDLFYVLQLQKGLSLALVDGDFDFGKAVCEGDLGKRLEQITVEGTKPTRVAVRTISQDVVCFGSFIPSQASLLSIYHSFTCLAKAHRILVPQPDLYSITTAYILALCEHKMFQEAIRLSGDLSMSSTEAKNKEMFEALLKEYGSSMSELGRATILYELATLSTSLGDDSARLRAIDEAEELFNRSGHAFGSLDCCRFRINHFLQKKLGSATAEECIEKTQELLQLVREYGELDYPAGVMRALDNLKTFYQTNLLIDGALTVAFECARISERMGYTLMNVHSQLQTLALLISQAGNFGKLVRAIEQLYPTASNMKTPFVAGTAASLAALAYTGMNQRQPAVRWAERCIKHWSLCLPEDLSNGKFFLFQARTITDGLTPAETQQELADLSNEIELRVERDISEGLYQLAIAKLEVLSVVETRRGKFIGAELALGRSIAVLRRMRGLVDYLPPELRGAARANSLQMKVSALLQMGKPRRDMEKEEEAIVCLEEALRDFVHQSMAYHAANTRQQLALCHIQILGKKMSGHNLSQAYTESTAAANLFESLDSVDQAASSNYWVAFVACKAWLLTNGGSIGLDVVMNHCDCADKWLRRKRSELSVLASMDTIASKRALSTERVSVSQPLYEIALEVCLAAGKFELAWEWVQRSKARSISDFLALHLHPPKDIESRARSDEKTAALLDRQGELYVQLASAPAGQKVIVRVKLERLESEMDTIPALAEILSLQQGRPIGLAQVETLLKNCRTEHDKWIALVDWIFVGDTLWMVVFSERTKVTCHRLKITLSAIKTWVQDNITSVSADSRWRKDDTDPDSTIHELSELVKPLAKFTVPDQLLVFSPTGILHSLPLHALHIDGRPLIERNPIVYCSSMTIFAQCISRAEARANAVADKANVLLVAAVYDEKSPAGLAEKRNIAAHAEALSERLHAQLLLDDQVTMSTLSAVLPKTSLLHFHGHYHYDDAHIQKQGLILSPELPPPSKPDSRASEDYPPLSQALNDLHLQDTVPSKPLPPLSLNPKDLLQSSTPDSSHKFTLSSALTLSLPSSHITLLACSSSLQSITPAGNEPLGLPTAFLVAGATSVLGTIWPVRSVDARVFAEMFYGEFTGESDKRVWDLAEGARRAALRVRGDVRSSQVRFWGGFVVQGAWFWGGNQREQ